MLRFRNRRHHGAHGRAAQQEQCSHLKWLALEQPESTERESENLANIASSAQPTPVPRHTEFTAVSHDVHSFWDALERGRAASQHAVQVRLNMEVYKNHCRVLLYKYRCEELHAAHHSVYVQVESDGEEVGSDQQASVTLAVARKSHLV